MIIKSSNIFVLIWFHRNISISKYVTKFFGSELFLRKTLFFFLKNSLNRNPIATSILCHDILVKQYTLATTIFDIRGFIVVTSTLMSSIIGAGRGSDDVAFSMTHFSGRVTSSHFIILFKETLAFVISVINKVVSPFCGCNRTLEAQVFMTLYWIL